MRVPVPQEAVMQKVASEFQHLKAENVRLRAERATLATFAMDYVCGIHDSLPDFDCKNDECRAARAALSSPEADRAKCAACATKGEYCPRHAALSSFPRQPYALPSICQTCGAEHFVGLTHQCEPAFPRQETETK